MTASQAGYFNIQEFTDAGSLLVSGRLYTYAAGTTTQKVAYTDAAGLVPQTYTADGQGGQYIALNARGELPSPLYLTGGAYDIALKRADGSTVWSRPAVGISDTPNASFVTYVASLAAAAGSALIGFVHSFTGAVQRTVQDRLRDLPPSFADAGAVIDGSTDNLSAVNFALSTPRTEIAVKEGTDVRVSVMPTNPYGPRMGPGRVILPLSSPFPGRQQINSDTELRGHTFGQEYLYAAQVKLQARTSFTALFSGDSTTAGDALVNTYSQIHSLVQAVVRDKGFDLTTVNGGHSGATAEQWRTTYLAPDLATNPDLYVIRWGINDPGWNKNGTVGTSNAYEAEYANRRDITDYATTMRAALTTIAPRRQWLKCRSSSWCPTAPATARTVAMKSGTSSAPGFCASAPETSNARSSTPMRSGATRVGPPACGWTTPSETAARSIRSTS
jgi:hypothetical protein